MAASSQNRDRCVACGDGMSDGSEVDRSQEFDDEQKDGTGRKERRGKERILPGTTTIIKVE